ncbi:hypothetical protein CO046_00110 [Candidatus Peregrinibacteria bacterium CG_4_9_14_0_2_um_filter_53_11]|nr:MAG: hypothetical protein CO046_00110 [Candidatus Peregrinibacteria bacterium CG_4_9_14_0_2_um_filter_53_11]
MQNFFKTAVLIFGFLIFIPVSFAEQRFSDVPENHSYAQAINYVKENNIANGYAETFGVDAPITRSEFVLMALKAANIKPAGSNCFSDVHNEWYAPALCAAKKRGIIRGYDDGTAQPAKIVTLAEAAVILSKSFGLPLDMSLSQSWEQPYAVALENRKAIPIGIVSLHNSVTRGTAAEMIWRLKTPAHAKKSHTYRDLVRAESEAMALIKKNVDQNKQPVQFLYDLYLKDSENDFVHGIFLDSFQELRSIPIIPEDQFPQLSEQTRLRMAVVEDFFVSDLKVDDYDNFIIPVELDGHIFIYDLGGKRFIYLPQFDETSARVLSTVIEPGEIDYIETVYIVDKNGLYEIDRKTKDIIEYKGGDSYDFNSFELGKYYGDFFKDKNYIYQLVGGILERVEGSDSASFASAYVDISVEDRLFYYKDDKQVYFPNTEGVLEVLPGADGETFTEYETGTWRAQMMVDKNRLYLLKYDHALIPFEGVDIDSFNIELLRKGINELGKADYDLVFKDENGVFVFDEDKNAYVHFIPSS